MLLKSYSGYLQIQQKGYWDDKNINNSLSIDKQLITELEEDPRVK